MHKQEDVASSEGVRALLAEHARALSCSLAAQTVEPEEPQTTVVSQLQAPIQLRRISASRCCPRFSQKHSLTESMSCATSDGRRRFTIVM